MDDIIESLARRFTATSLPGEVATADGAFFTPVLVIDYNAGNNLAITVEVEEREPRPGSPGDVPVTVLGSNVTAAALVQRVRSLADVERDLTAAGRTQPEPAGAVISRLIPMIQRPEA